MHLNVSNLSPCRKPPFVNDGPVNEHAMEFVAITMLNGVSEKM